MRLTYLLCAVPAFLAKFTSAMTQTLGWLPIHSYDTPHNFKWTGLQCWYVEGNPHPHLIYNVPKFCYSDSMSIEFRFPVAIGRVLNEWSTIWSQEQWWFKITAFVALLHDHRRSDPSKYWREVWVQNIFSSDEYMFFPRNVIQGAIFGRKRHVRWKEFHQSDERDTCAEFLPAHGTRTRRHLCPHILGDGPLSNVRHSHRKRNSASCLKVLLSPHNHTQNSNSFAPKVGDNH